MSLIPIRFHIRHISRLDSQQLVEVEKDAFPTLWPPTSFNREINNKLAVYLVAVALDDVSDIPYVSFRKSGPAHSAFSCRQCPAPTLARDTGPRQ